jgi:hypothetical protein
LNDLISTSAWRFSSLWPAVQPADLQLEFLALLLLGLDGGLDRGLCLRLDDLVERPFDLAMRSVSTVGAAELLHFLVDLSASTSP